MAQLVKDIFIGIDGGATKSKVRVENGLGEVLGQSVGGPANIRISVDKSWESIYQALEDALKPAEIRLEDNRYHFHLGLGLAGCEVTQAVDEFLSRPHPFANICLTSDAHAACVGAHKGHDGAIIIVGTGVVGYQIEKHQNRRVGGWGFPHDDEGSGAWLGLEAARLTFQWRDHRIEKSPLVEDVFAFFENDIERFTTWANQANSSEFARLAPFVINHSQQQEVLAVRLMKKAAQAIDRVATALFKLQTRHDNHLPCSLFGGIAPFMEPWLSEELRSILVPRQADANVGAIMMIHDYIKQRQV